MFSWPEDMLFERLLFKKLKLLLANALDESHDMRYVFVTVVLGVLSLTPFFVDYFQVMILLLIVMITWAMGQSSRRIVMRARWRP